MAERTKFISYCIYSAVISAVVYPISGHWIWGGGWLAQMGFHDFAGSAAVHMVGGVASIVGAKILGPRIGKYNKDGTPNAIPGHSLTLGALGVFILWFCWFGFNGGSTVSMTGDDVIYSVGNIFVTTNMAAAVSTVSTMIITWLRYKKPDVSMTLNGSLACLVAITASTDVVSPVGSFFIGIIASFVVVFGIEFIDKVLKIDDPVGAIGVHGLCGLAGTLCVGLFAVDGGLFYGGGFGLLGIQALGVVSVVAWVVITMTIVFTIIKNVVGLRVSAEEEITGLDVTEHGLVSSYADFMSTSEALPPVTMPAAKPTVDVVDRRTATAADGTAHKLTKLSIVFNPSYLDMMKREMNRIGVTGMTVSNVMGCGTQKGRIGFYRGVKTETVELLPKMMMEMVVSAVPVQDVIDAAMHVLYTGNIGDGKIFIYNVENVIKISTGEEGYEALQGINQE